MPHSAIQSPVLSTESLNASAECSTRKLRTRAPKSYVLPGLLKEDDFDYVPQTNLSVKIDKKSASSISTVLSADEPQNGSVTNNSSKPTGRLLISHQHRVFTPPPLPSCTLSYLQTDKFPAWLLGDSMVRSSPNYLSHQASPTALSTSQLHVQTSPVRGNGSSLLLNSSLNRQSVSENRSSHPTQPLSSPGENSETRREQFWECYEYDNTAPHLQPRYFDKPLPSSEQWSDLDIQNCGTIPAPINGSPITHLFEVYAPSITDSASQGTLGNKIVKDESPNQKINSLPFGFNFLPSDYNGHQY